jgi:hypothetical protein
MRRDFPRNRMPANVAWGLTDFLPDLGAAARKRGGWSNASDVFTSVHAGADYADGGIYAPFVAAPKLLAISVDSGVAAKLISVNLSTQAVTDLGFLNNAVRQNPVFHRDLVIIPFYNGTTAPQSYNGTTLANLAGSPPNAIYATVHKDRTVLANTTADPTTLWFSDPGDPETWDVTNSFFSTSFPVTGLASIRNAILVWSEGAVERITGSTPPPETDFNFGPLFTEGTPDARSIAYWGDNVVWANPSGIFISDGSALDDLTKACGMLSYWQDALQGYTTSWTLGAGVYQSYYVIAVMNGGSVVDGAMIDLVKRNWVRLTNLPVTSFWNSNAPDEMYMGLRSSARLGKFSTVLAPTASVKNDGNGTAVTPSYESPFFDSEGEMLSWRRMYADVYMTDAASDNPAVTLSYIETPEATSYTALTPTVTENTAQRRYRRVVNRSNFGMAFKVTQANASGDTRFTRLSGEVHKREGSRVV